MTMDGATYSYADRCHEYARQVSEGEIPACKWVRLAAERHLNDLKRKGWKYVFDPKKADRPCRFIEKLPHTKGMWASKRETIQLEDWQIFLVCCLFGWISRETGLRRFRKVLWLIPRKNGKSILAAAIGLYMLALDDEFGAEVYSGATSEQQAWEVFRPAKQIAERTPKLRERFGIEVNAKSLVVPNTGSRFAPVIGKPGDGSSPSCSIHDEYHEHQTDEQVDTMETGMGARQQPIQLIVTTAGSDMAGPCYSAVVNGRRMLDGVHDQEELFFVEYGIDDSDDWATEEALKKANPNYGVSVFPELLLSRLEEAKNNARKQGTFQTKHLNQWVGARSAFFNVRKWGELENPELKIEDMAGRPCFVGLDLASKVDIASLVHLFPPQEDGDKWRIFHTGYLPEETVWQTENEHYHGWARDGWLLTTEGDVTDYERIRDDILSDSSIYQIEDVAYDPHQATMLVNELMSHGVPVVEYRPTVLNFSEPMKSLDALIRSGEIEHNGDPVLTWMIANTVAKEDAKDNVYPRKEQPENKIDGVVAAIMALGRAQAKQDMDISEFLSSPIIG